MAKKNVFELDDAVPTGSKIYLAPPDTKYLKNGYVQVAAYLREASDIPLVKPTPKNLKLQAQRKEWAAEYSAMLLRLNNFWFKLQAAGKNYQTSKKYAELREQVNIIHDRLRQTKPQYKGQ